MKLRFLLLAAAAACVLSACAGRSNEPAASPADPAAAEETASVPSGGEASPAGIDPEQAKETKQGGNVGRAVCSPAPKTEADEKEFTKITCSIDYHRVSPFLAEQYDAETIAAAHQVIDAFLRDETEIETPEMFRYEQETVHSLVRLLCPPFVAFCEVEYAAAIGSSDTSTVFSWRYRIPREEIDRKLVEFDAAIAGYTADVYEEDTEAMKALCVYYAYGGDLRYDTQSAEDDVGGLPPDKAAYRTSSFCALVDHTGVCYNISEGLAFLFNVVGINAGTVGSYAGAGAHDWTIAEIDGRFYYFDATWDVNEGEWDSLVYFGITEEDRAGWAGGYPPESVEFNCSAEIHGRYDLSDTRFEPIHGEQVRIVYALEIDRAAQTVCVLTDCGVLFMDMH